MNKSNKLGIKVLGLVCTLALIHRFLGLEIAFWVAISIIAGAFWMLFEDRL